MNIVLFSINPKYAMAILKGKKRVEFRRVPPRGSFSHGVIYATRPVCAVIGYFNVIGVTRATTQVLWEKYGEICGISNDEFLDYFRNRDSGAAIVIQKAIALPKPVPLRDLGIERAPQSFAYLPEIVLKKLEEYRHAH